MYTWVELGGGGGGMGLYSLGGMSPVFSGPRPHYFKHTIGILSSIPVDCHPLLSKLDKRGGLWMFKSQGHTHSGAGCGVSQATGAALLFQTSRIVPA